MLDPPTPALGPPYGTGEGGGVTIERGGETITKQYDVAAP